METQCIGDNAENENNIGAPNKVMKRQRWSMDTNNVLYTHYERNSDNGTLVKAIRGRHSTDGTLLFPGWCLHNGSS